MQWRCLGNTAGGAVLRRTASTNGCDPGVPPRSGLAPIQFPPLVRSLLGRRGPPESGARVAGAVAIPLCLQHIPASCASRIVRSHHPLRLRTAVELPLMCLHSFRCILGPRCALVPLCARFRCALGSAVHCCRCPSPKWHRQREQRRHPSSPRPCGRPSWGRNSRPWCGWN